MSADGRRESDTRRTSVTKVFKRRKKWFYFSEIRFAVSCNKSINMKTVKLKPQRIRTLLHVFIIIIIASFCSAKVLFNVYPDLVINGLGIC